MQRENNSNDKTVPYGLSSEIWFKFSEPKTDAYSLSSEKNTQISQNSAFSEVKFWENGPFSSELDFWESRLLRILVIITVS